MRLAIVDGERCVGGMERGFTVVVCRACNDPPCAKVCPTGALENLLDGCSSQSWLDFAFNIRYTPKQFY